MLNLNLNDVLRAAKVANAAYIGDQQKAEIAFNALGYELVGRHRDGDHQLYVLHGFGVVTLAFAGTRVWHSIGDLKDDANIGVWKVDEQRHVAAGPMQGMATITQWAGLLGQGAMFDIVGHSLGAERALLSGLFFSPEKIRNVYAFEAPKCANAATWTSLSDYLAKTICVINGNDFWAAHPLIGGWERPDVLHMHIEDDNGTYKLLMPSDLPPLFDPLDHDIERVIERLEKRIVLNQSSSVLTNS